MSLNQQLHNRNPATLVDTDMDEKHAFRCSVGRDVNVNDFPKTDSINAANDVDGNDDDNSNGIG